MTIYRDLNFEQNAPVALALGCFDGVHLGHRAVINAAKKQADSLGVELAVFTFDTPPRNFFCPDTVPMITSTEQKLELLEELGVNICVCLPCSEDIFSLPPHIFIEEIIFSKLRAAHIVCGFDYSFGKGGKGDPQLLTEHCEAHGVGISVIEEQTLDGISVSSSLVRALVAAGDVATAARLLGRPHNIISKVVDGQHLARTLGFPTVNTLPPKGLLLPQNGVYVSRISFGNTQKYGITNVGMRPTVGTKILCAETHIFDFQGDLYGQQINVEFLDFIREETKFESVEQMAQQIHKDIAIAKAYVMDAGGRGDAFLLPFLKKR